MASNTIKRIDRIESNSTSDVIIAPNTGRAEVESADIIADNIKKNNVFASVDPAVTNDDTEGYEQGSRWVNQSSNAEFLCKDATTGAAVWEQLAGGGGGGGGVDAYVADNFESTTASDFTTGNDAIFLNGGTLQGTLTDETTTPIQGSQSINYTQAVGSLNDWIAYPDITIQAFQQGKTNKCIIYSEYSGDNDDLKALIWDATNSNELASTLIKKTNTGQGARYEFDFFVPTNTTTVNFGFQTLVENNGAILIFDLLELSIVDVPNAKTEDFEIYNISQAGSAMTDRSGEAEFNLGTATQTREGSLEIIRPVDDVGNTRTQFFADIPCRIEVNFSCPITTVGNEANIYKNGTLITVVGSTMNSPGDFSNISASINMLPGDFISVGVDGDSIENSASIASLNMKAVASFNAFVQSNDQGWFDYTPVFQGYGVPSSVEIKAKYVGDDLLVRGTFVAGATTGVEARIGFPAGIVSSANISTLEIAGWMGRNVAEAQALVALREPGVTYFTMTNIGGAGGTGTKENANLRFGAGNIVQIDARCPIAGGLSQPQIVPAIRSVTINETKASGSGAGTPVAGSYQTRIFNTIISGPDGSFAQLSSNQITLPKGRYKVHATVPGFAVDSHKAKLVNVTDVVDVIIGSSVEASSVVAATTYSVIQGVFDIDAAKTFEVQQRVDTAQPDGLGTATGFGDSEIYAQITIDKIL